MAQKKISELAAVTTVSDDDIICVVDDPGGTPVTKKITVANLKIAILGTDHNQNGTHKAAVYNTGDIKETISSVAPSGWLLCTGPGANKTVGDASSGADYAGAQYQALFQMIVDEAWNTPTGTWAAHGRVALPDFRDLVRVGVSATKPLASAGGAASVTLTAAQSGSPAHNHPASSDVESNDHNHSGNTGDQSQTHNHGMSTNTGDAGCGGGSHTMSSYYSGFYTWNASNGHTHAFTTNGRSATHTHAITVSNSIAVDAAQAHNNMQPYKSTNVIIKI